MQVKISKGNTKMGSIPSVSLPSVVTCRQDCECCIKCYARKLERIRPTVRNAYRSNLDLLLKDPDTYWREVETAVSLSRFFRFHVSGDIPSPEYLSHMVSVASRNPSCEILCFTKRYDFVNRYLDTGAKLPANLHLIFSGWRGLPMVNPYRLPEAHVVYRDGTTTASSKARFCGGNCTQCAATSEGCWTLGKGDQIKFREH